MDIRKKTILCVLTGSLIVTFIVILGIYSFFTFSINAAEKQEVKDDEKRIGYVMNQGLERLNLFSADWAAWNDTAVFVNDLNSKYIDNNLNKETLADTDVNFIAYFDKKNTLKYIVNYDSNNDEIVPAGKDLIDFIKKNKLLICNYKNISDLNSGVINVGKDIMLISSRPIADSTYSSGINGTLLVGCKLNEETISGIEKTTLGEVTIKNINESKKSTAEVSFTDNGIKLTSSHIVKGIWNTPGFIIVIKKASRIHSDIINFVNAFFVMVLLSIIIISIFYTLFFRKYIINPIKHLEASIRNIDLNDNSLKKLHFKGNDEISSLASEINNMLIKIEENNLRISEDERQMKLILDGANVGFWNWKVTDDRFFANDKLLSLLEYLPDEIGHSFKSIRKLLHDDDFKLLQNELSRVCKEYTATFSIELRLLSKKNDYRWFLVKGSIVDRDENDKPLWLTGICADINSQKKSEEQLAYTKYFDKLTGLANRIYFDYFLDKINLMEDLSYSIIIGDINGLRNINDLLGYEEGNKIIIKVAEVLISCCKESDLIARWGGDSFAIFSYSIDEMEIKELCKNIKASIDVQQNSSFNLSLALGYSIQSEIKKDVVELTKEAEERMNRNKLFEVNSSRNGIIVSLLRALSEKSYETEEHTERMHKTCLKIGKIMNLSNSQIDELTLLASLHDIGKIAISDDILNKPGRLTDDEFKIMKTHCEAGFRIAHSTHELKHIAHAILSHHERYDGRGYPKGLKGNEIPLISRIMAIVDSYDVITHDRSYKKASPPEEAFVELRRCSGTQFDPGLVEICIQAFMEDNKNS